MGGGETDAQSRGAARHGGEADRGHHETGVREGGGGRERGFVGAENDRNDRGGGIADQGDVFPKFSAELPAFVGADESSEASAAWARAGGGAVE